MRIVHAPTQIAGQMTALVNGLRERGHIVNGYNWFHSYLKYDGEIANTDAYEMINMIEPLVRYAEMIHFHNGNSFAIHNADLPYIKETGIRMLMHHWGNDVRTSAGSRAVNKYNIPPSYLSDESIHNRLMLLSSHIKHAIVQDYELYPYVSDYYEHVHVLPLACQADKIPYTPYSNKPVPIIVHAPTNKEFKGSLYVEKAIKDLTGKHRFRYKEVEKMNHQEAMRIYAEADIIIDQLLSGTYGMLSVEAMAMGKVVIAYIRDDLVSKFPKDLPIVIANPDNIHSVISDLLLAPELRRQIGIASRAFVQKHHDIKAVIPKLLAIYNQIEGD